MSISTQHLPSASTSGSPCLDIFCATASLVHDLGVDQNPSVAETLGSTEAPIRSASPYRKRGEAGKRAEAPGGRRDSSNSVLFGANRVGEMWESGCVVEELLDAVDWLRLKHRRL
ncbi:hypothetical protein ACFE04_020981 [Oxalis oulophora]